MSGMMVLGYDLGPWPFITGVCMILWSGYKFWKVKGESWWRKHTGVYLPPAARYILMPPKEIQQVDSWFQKNHKVKKLAWREGQKELTNNQKFFCQALFRRAMADVPWIDQFNSDLNGHYRAFMNNCLPLESWEEVQGYKNYVQHEINRVMWLANKVNPGMEKEIWGQARNKYNAIKNAQEIAQLKAEEKRARDKAKRGKKDATKAAKKSTKSAKQLEEVSEEAKAQEKAAKHNELRKKLHQKLAAKRANKRR